MLLTEGGVPRTRPPGYPQGGYLQSSFLVKPGRGNIVLEGKEPVTELIWG